MLNQEDQEVQDAAPGNERDAASLPSRRRPKRRKPNVTPLIVLVLLVVLWEAVVKLFGVADYLVPAPTQVLESISENSESLLDDSLVTLKEIVLGYLIGVVAGVLVALLIHLIPPLKNSIFPLLIGSQTIPIVVIAPILVVIFGFGMGPKLIIVALICFFPVAITTVDGLEAVDREMKDLMATLRGNRWDTLRKVDIPSALPAFFSGSKIAATYSSIGAVFAEWSGASAGLGFSIQQSLASLNTAYMFAAVVVLSVIALAVVGIVTLIERLTIPWSPRFRSND